MFSVVGYRSGLIGGFVALSVLGLAWKSGGYEPVTSLPPTVNPNPPTPPPTTPPPPTPPVTPLPADISVSIPLRRGMFVTYWTAPVIGSWKQAGGSARIGTPEDRIPGLLPNLLSYDRTEDWFKSTSSRVGKIRILHDTSVVKLTMGMTPLKRGQKAEDFIFHFVIRDSNYDTVLDSGTKIVHVQSVRGIRRSVRRSPRQIGKAVR